MATTGVYANTLISTLAVSDIYTGPANTVTALTLNICNKNGVACRINVAMANASSASANDFIEFLTTVPAYTTYERTQLVISGGIHLLVSADANNVSAVVYGYRDTV